MLIVLLAGVLVVAATAPAIVAGTTVRRVNVFFLGQGRRWRSGGDEEGSN